MSVYVGGTALELTLVLFDVGRVFAGRSLRRRENLKFS